MQGEVETAEQASLMWPKHGDPVAQASLYVPERMYPWQVSLMRDLMPAGARVACVTPNESGKTSVVIPVLGLSYMAAFPGSQVVSTSGVSRQIEEQLWPVLRHALSRFPGWTITDDLEIRAPSVRGLPPSTWKAFTTKDPNYAEGFHGRWYNDNRGVRVRAPLLIIIDEAKSFTDPDMFNAFRRCDPDHWLVISTPGEDSGPFFDCFHVARNRPWKCHEIGWEDCPHLRSGTKLKARQDMIAERGEDDPIVQSMVFGKFFRRGGKVIFDDMAGVEFCMSGLVGHVRGVRKAALDFSGGGDEQVFACRDGNAMVDLQAFHEHDTVKLGERFIGLFTRWELKPEDITGDNGGLGKPIIDYLESRGWRGIRRYMADDDARDKTRFVNRAAEDTFELKYRIGRREVALIRDELLLDQMRRRKFMMPNSDNNLIRLEPKDKMRARGEKSPDRLDTVTMLFADAPKVMAGSVAARIGSARCGYAEECFQAPERSETGVFASQWFED